MVFNSNIWKLYALYQELLRPLAFILSRLTSVIAIISIGLITQGLSIMRQNQKDETVTG